MSHILPNSSAMVIDSLLTSPVLAHAGELHGRPAAPETTSDEDNGNTDSGTLESEVPEASIQTEANTVIEVDASAPTPVIALPVGLGEFLFTVLIACPWLLLVLRTKLHTKTRS